MTDFGCVNLASLFFMYQDFYEKCRNAGCIVSLSLLFLFVYFFVLPSLLTCFFFFFVGTLSSTTSTTTQMLKGMVKV